MDIREVLEELGYKLRDSGEFWTTQAIYRNGNNPGALSIRKSNGAFVDFVTNEKGSFQTLVNITTKDVKKTKGLLSSLQIENTNECIPTQKIKKKKVFPPEILNRLLPHYEFFTNKGISVDTLKLFQIGLAQSAKLRNRYCIPIYDSENKIIGFTGRWFKEVPYGKIPKYKNEGDKKDWVWPLHLSKQYIKSSGELILVESPNCVIHLWDAGIKNVICLFGISMGTKILQYLLSEMDIKLIIISTNFEPKNNNRGEIAAKKIKQKLDKYFDKHKSVIYLPTKKDFAIMTKTEILKWKESNLLN